MCSRKIRGLNKKLSIGLAIVLPFVAYFLGFQAGFSRSTPAPLELKIESADLKMTFDESLDWRLFGDVWEKVNAKFVDTDQLDPQRMLYGAMKGVVRSLGDPHSEFLDPTESEEFLESLDGSLTGIGAEVGIRNDLLVVVSPLRDSPAEHAGLAPGDHIFKIDDEFASDFSLFEAVKHIRGEPGTDVTLTIFREEEIEPREITITRAFIDIESVITEIRDDDIAIVIVTTFADDTAVEFSTALAEVALANPRGMILDLRNNGGGFLDAAIEMTSKLLAEGEVVTIHERGRSDKILNVLGAPILPQTPLVVLINEGSASASEIMAGALQDNGRATIIGEQSFGKGTVQELINSFADGSILRITVAKWFTPSGRDVTLEGIVPDFEVVLTAADFFAERDPQIDAAVEFLTTGQIESLVTED